MFSKRPFNGSRKPPLSYTHEHKHECTGTIYGLTALPLFFPLPPVSLTQSMKIYRSLPPNTHVCEHSSALLCTYSTCTTGKYSPSSFLFTPENIQLFIPLPLFCHYFTEAQRANNMVILKRPLDKDILPEK